MLKLIPPGRLDVPNKSKFALLFWADEVFILILLAFMKSKQMVISYLGEVDGFGSAPCQRRGGRLISHRLLD